MADNNSFAITVAPNGGRRNKADHPAIPLTASELASTAAQCADAGAAMIHIHVRDKDGRHSLSQYLFHKAISAIRQEVGSQIVVQITTEALGMFSSHEQMDVVRQLRPEAVSLALREVLPTPEADGAVLEFSNFLKFVNDAEIIPQFILYSPDELKLLLGLTARGIVPWSSVPVLYVLGRYSPDQQSRPSEIIPFLEAAKDKFPNWTVCAFGRQEAACVLAGAFLGGNARVGFENNLHMPDGTIARSNDDLVRFVADKGRSFSRRPLTADEVRADWMKTKR